MKLRFFHVPMIAGEAEADELNRFLATNRVVMVERHFVPDGVRSAWAICVGYLDRGGRSPAETNGKRIDYRERLSESDFAVYARLRNLRKTLAEKDGLPAYTLFTNEQLAAMVQQRVTSLKALEEIPGVGPARVGKYGAAFLEVLRSAWPSTPEADDGKAKTPEARAH